MEATPIVVDGRLYVTSTWSMVYAFDAKTGALLWQHDPEVPRQWAVHLCCDAVNRGVAAWGGKVFVGTIDGRLQALDANDGKLLWSVQTTPVDKPYSITGAPRVVKGLVIIGNGGSELGVRGYVSAYDAETGEQKWRFYTVPGDPAQPFRIARAGAGGGDLVGRRVVEDRRRRHGVGLDGLRPGAGPALHRGRQRLAVEPAVPQPGRRRQPVPVLDRGARPGYRRLRLALPDHARRHLGLHRDAAPDPRRSHHRRHAAQGDHAGAEERLLLRARSRERGVPLGRCLCLPDLGQGHRRRRPPGPQRTRRATSARRRWCSRRPTARTTGTR